MTSLLAFALLRLRGVAGWGGWRWLFLIEGLITFAVSTQYLDKLLLRVYMLCKPEKNRQF